MDLLVTAGDSLIGKAIDLVSNKIVKKWRLHREKVFFESFVSSVAEELASKCIYEAVDDYLERISDNELASEILFDAYRRVALSASKTLGPRIIALLTAKIVVSCRAATEEEQRIFMAAERCTDKELLAFADYVNSNRKDSSKADLEINLGQDVADLGSDYEIDVGPVALDVELGPWAVSFSNLSILKTRIV